MGNYKGGRLSYVLSKKLPTYGMNPSRFSLKCTMAGGGEEGSWKEELSKARQDEAGSHKGTEELSALSPCCKHLDFKSHVKSAKNLFQHLPTMFFN